MKKSTIETLKEYIAAVAILGLAWLITWAYFAITPGYYQKIGRKKMQVLNKLYSLKNDLEEAKSWGDIERATSYLEKIIEELEG